jgi:lipopolysaccharide biosynthesis glycosyltransferase
VSARNAAIVLSLNDRFILPARATIESIGRNGGALDGVTLVVLTTGLSPASVEALRASASRARLPLAVRTVTDIGELGAIPSWAVSTCLRLYLGDVCREFDRALYLDSDMLILSHLGPVLDVELGGRTAAAVLNHPPLDVMRVAIPRSRRGAADPDAPYFNAGVLMVDVGRWASREVGPRSRGFISQFPTTRLLDQDALNVALVNDWVHLDKAWNIPAGPLDEAPMLRGLSQMNPSMIEALDAWKRAQKHPKILHFTGQPKPWEAGYPWRDLQAQYEAYISPDFGSDWPSSRPDAVVDPDTTQKVREFRRT